MDTFHDLYHSIDWHDLTVESIQIDATNKKLIVGIDIYIEEIDDFILYKLEFIDIISLNTTKGDLNDLLSFDLKYDLEINYSDYKQNENGNLHFDFLLLLGSGKPVIKFEIIAKTILLNPAV